MTTTISKHEVQQQQQHQQHQQQQLQQVTATTATATRTEPQPNAAIDTLNNNNDIDDVAGSVAATGLKCQKRRSLLNFKSFDFHIKSLYSGLRTPGNALAETPQQTNAAAGSRASLGGSTTTAAVAAAAAPGAARPTPPHLRIEAVDAEPEREEGSNLLLDYGQSPYTPRRNSSTQLLSINRYSSACATLSPYLLSPYMQVPGGGAAGGSSGADGDSSGGSIRRSSTSDIVARRSSTASGANSRRPSTSDLLRRARERRGSEARMGRSVSHSAMGRSGAGGGGGGCMGGRRTSMAF